MSKRKIHAACMTQNELSEIVPNIEHILPYVDSMTVVDGGSQDGTLIYFRNWEKKEPKLRFFLYPWRDDFPGQRNNYVKHVAEIAKDGDWLLTFDADEWFEELALQKLQAAADRAEQDGRNMVGFQCRAISMCGPEKVHENLDDYWKHLFIKWDPNFHYVGRLCHEGKGGVPHNIMNTSLVYQHIKQQNVTWIRGMRNSIVGGSGDNLGDSCPNFVRVKQLLANEGIKGWHQLYSYMLKGNIAPEIKQFMEELVFEGTPKAGPNCWRNYDWPGASEWREWYKSYFRILHPEEETAFVDVPNLDDPKFLGWKVDG